MSAVLGPASQARTIELIEGQPTYLTPAELSEEYAITIARSKLVEVDFPSPLNGRRYVLRPTNTVGLLPVSNQLLLRVLPKVPIQYLFGMLEAVHQLRSFQFYPGVGRVEALEEVCARVAAIFAQRVLHRVRRGLYASYATHEEETLQVRGRIDLERSMRLQACGSIGMHCSHEQQSIDNEDNQILLCALDRIPRLGLGEGPALALVRAARRALHGAVTLTSISGRQCVNRSYNRLNADYALLHALARFFLERMGPGLNGGDHAFLPFTVNMAMLFQEYVVACLKRHAPSHLMVTRQYVTRPAGDFEVTFSMDAVIKERASGRVVAIVDAKYKRDATPSARDIEQVIAYAAQTGARRAFLIYPMRLPGEGKIAVGVSGELDVFAASLSLRGELSATAADFARNVFSRL